MNVKELIFRYRIGMMRPHSEELRESVSCEMVVESIRLIRRIFRHPGFLISHRGTKGQKAESSVTIKSSSLKPYSCSGTGVSYLWLGVIVLFLTL